MNLIVDIYNIRLFIVSRSSAIKNRNSISDIRDSYGILVSVLKRCDSSLKILMMIVRSIRKL
jgi:hypothetical protein